MKLQNISPFVALFPSRSTLCVRVLFALIVVSIVLSEYLVAARLPFPNELHKNSTPSMLPGSLGTSSVVSENEEANGCNSAWEHVKDSNRVNILGKYFEGHPQIMNKILFVHIVGKAGGSSVSAFLRKSGLPFDEVHLYRVEPNMVEHYSDIEISVRDPVARSVSAYVYGHPSYSMPNRSRMNFTVALKN